MEARVLNEGKGHVHSNAGLDRFSNELPKFLGCESRILNYTAHRERIHLVRARYCEDSFAVAHDNMLAFSNHPKASLLERANGTRV